MTQSIELAYHLMQRLWHQLELKRHFEDDYLFSQSIIKTLTNYIELSQPKIVAKLRKTG